ncbi:YxiG family protein [Bacillus pumilus]|uniref:YxiG family protein n=1 Tax=Bacillus TaxID=1386 RepID=UPI003F5CF059
MNELFSSIEKWIDYLDGVCDVLAFSFDFFCKELVINISITEINDARYHELRFMNVASLYYNGGEGNDRFEELIQEEMNWQIFECSYHPQGIGNLKNELLEEFEANANFLFNINGMLLAIESKNVCFDSKEFICSV